MHNPPPSRRDDFLDAVFDKPKAKVLSNDTNFSDSTGPTHGSCRKNSREAASADFEMTNQTST